MFRLTNLIVLANLITGCLSCTYCLDCNSILENKFNVNAQFRIPDMKRCVNEKNDLAPSLCVLKYCIFEITVDFAYEDLNNKKKLDDVKAKYIKLNRGCTSAPALKYECNLFNNTEKRTFRKSCIVICNTFRCNGNDPRLYFNKFRGVDAYPQCQICEETVNIESINDFLYTTSCFRTNGGVLPYDVKLISCVGLCFSHIRYNDLKLTYEKGCYTKLQEILKKTYSISHYKTCGNVKRKVCNRGLMFPYDVKIKPKFKNLNNYIEMDLEKKRSGVNSTKCRVCKTTGDPTDNERCNSKQIESSKECYIGCFVVFKLNRYPNNNKMELSRDCFNKNNRTEEPNKHMDLDCFGEMDLRENRYMVTMNIKNDFTIEINYLIECINVCIMYYRDTCIGYNFNESTNICEGYTTKGNAKEMEHTFYKVDHYELTCMLNCKRGFHTNCAIADGALLLKRWREKMDMYTKFRIIIKNKTKDTNVPAKTSESIGDPNTTLMIIVVFVTCVISLLAIFVSIRRGLSKYPKTNKKEIFVDSSRIQPYYSGAE